MKQKTKQLQSSGETRKTNRTWHFLSTLNSLLLSKLLLLLIIPAIGSTAAWADDTYYYGNMKLTDGALTKGDTGSSVLFVKGGTTLTSSTDLSLSSTPDVGSIYYTSSSLSASDLGTSSNWGSSQSSNRRIRGLKFASGTNYTLALGAKVATSITFYGWCGSSSKTLTIGGVSYGTPSTKNEFFHNEFTKSGNFTGNVTISQDGDMYGILVIVVSSTPATPTTTTLTVIPNEGSVYVGKTLDISGNVDTNSDATVTYTSDDESVATVTSAGVISGKAAGSATITVAQDANASYTAANATFSITVNAAPTQYTVTLASSPAAGGSVSGKYNTADAYNGKAINDDFSSGDEVSENTRLTLTASPNTGYQFANSWGGSGATDATFTTAKTTSNKTYTANFSPKPYPITLDKGTGGATDGSATATYNSNKLTGITAPTHATATKVLEGYYKEAGCTNKIADASGNLVASTAYTNGSSQWTNDAATTVTLFAKWVDASSSYTPFDLSSADAVIDFSESKWSDATALFDAANVGNGANTPINDVVFRGQTNGTKKAFTISDGKLVMDVGNGQSGNRWFAIPLTNINGRIDVYIKTPYAKGTTFSVKAVLDKGTTTVGTSATNLNAVKLDYVDNYFGTGEGAFHFRIKDLAVSEGVLYIGRNGSSWTTIEKIEVSTLAAGNLIKAPGKIIVGDGNTATVTIKNNSATKTMKLVSQPSYVSCTFSPSSGELIVTPTAIGSGKNISIALEDDSSPVSIPVEVKGITSVSNLTSKVYEYGATADALSVTAAKSSSLGKYTYTWYKNTVNSTTGGVVVKTESNTSSETSTYTPSTTLAAEDASFYYCEVSVPGDTIQTKTSNVAYVLTSSTGRYFQMSNVAGNKSTSETSIEVTGQKIAGGKATFRKDGSTKYYVLRPDGYGHYYHLASSNSFMVELSKAITAGDVISAKVQGLGQETVRGIWISNSDSRPVSAPDSKLVTSANNTEVTKTYTVQAGDAIVGKKTIYIYGNTNSADYFTDLIIYTPGDVEITDPASQTIQEGETPTPLTVTASNGTGPFSFQWQKKVGNGDWTNVTIDTDGTVTTVDATSTFQPVALTATTSYRCTVTDNTTSKTATSEAAVITVNAYSHGYYTPSFGDSNTVIYVLNKTNYDGQNKTGTDRGSDTNYWQYTGSVGFETQNIKDISVDAAKYMKIKSGASITFDVKGATAFVIYAGNGNNTSRTFDIKVDGTKVGTQIQNLTWGNLYAINQSGSRITITNANGDIFIDAIKFFKRAPAIITIKKDNVAVTEATQYRADGAVDYAVETNSGGTFDTPTSSNSSVATATYSDGVLTVTPVGKGTATITLHQNAETGAGATYIENDAKLIVNVKNYAVNMSFSYTSVEIKKSDLTAGNSIASSKLPTLTITHEDGTPNAATIKWLSDETSIATVPANTGTSTDYTVTYGSRGLSGGVRIYAYVEDTDKYGSASAYFDLVVKDGTPNKFEKAGESITVQQQYTLDNTSGAPVVTITYGGYKYLKDKTGKWSNTAVINKNHDYSIDGYKYYSSYEKDDATAEYTYKNTEKKDRYYNLKGMKDDWNANSMDSDGETPADAYPDGMWYKKGEVKPQGGTYAEYERIRPLALPCRGSYLKFEPKKSGVLTAYVVQNGVIGRGDNSNQLASKPRLGYWFDQDGWVQQPTVEPVAKQPILKGNGIDSHVFEGKNLREQMTTYWTSANDDDDMITLLTNKWINVEKPNRTNVVDPNTHFSNADTKPDGYYDNPYYWGTNEEVKKNLDKIPAPTNITPVPYHNGYLVPEKCYVKYTLNVVAGKTYYFYGMMTKVGYVGLNFVEAAEDGTGALTTSGFEDFSHETRRLDLKADDDWSTIFGTGEGSKLKNGENTIYDEVTLPSHYRANKWNTICLPFALSENQVEAAFGKGTQLAIYNGLRHDTDKHIYYVKYLRHVDQNILPGQPYLIYPTGTDVAINDDGIIGSVIDDAPDTNKRISFSNVVVEKDKLNQATANYGNNKDVDGVTESFRFTPTYSPVELEKYSLFYSPTNGKLYRWMKDGGTFATYRAYMKPNSDEVKANSLSFGFSNEDIENTWEENGTDGQETSVIIIEEIGGGQTMISNTSNGKAYNMMGQEVDPTSAKGIVIINGKKYMFN